MLVLFLVSSCKKNQDNTSSNNIQGDTLINNTLYGNIANWNLGSGKTLKYSFLLNTGGSQTIGTGSIDENGKFSIELPDATGTLYPHPIINRLLFDEVGIGYYYTDSLVISNPLAKVMNGQGLVVYDGTTWKGRLFRADDINYASPNEYALQWGGYSFCSYAELLFVDNNVNITGIRWVTDPNWVQILVEMNLHLKKGWNEKVVFKNNEGKFFLTSFKTSNTKLKWYFTSEGWK